MADALLLCFVGWWVLAFFETQETQETQETRENSRTTNDAIFSWSLRSQNSNSVISTHVALFSLFSPKPLVYRKLFVSL